MIRPDASAACAISGALRGERFPKCLRLRSDREFEAVFAGQHVAVDQVLVIHALPNQLPYSRLGLSVSKRVGNAPLRNTWKRLIREAFRRQRAYLPVGLDLVVRPRKGSQPQYHAVTQSLSKLVSQLGRQLHCNKARGG